MIGLLGGSNGGLGGLLGGGGESGLLGGILGGGEGGGLLGGLLNAKQGLLGGLLGGGGGNGIGGMLNGLTGGLQDGSATGGNEKPTAQAQIQAPQVQVQGQQPQIQGMLLNSQVPQLQGQGYMQMTQQMQPQHGQFTAGQALPMQTFSGQGMAGHSHCMGNNGHYSAMPAQSGFYTAMPGQGGYQVLPAQQPTINNSFAIPTAPQVQVTANTGAGANVNAHDNAHSHTGGNAAGGGLLGGLLGGGADGGMLGGGMLGGLGSIIGLPLNLFSTLVDHDGAAQAAQNGDIAGWLINTFDHTSHTHPLGGSAATGASSPLSIVGTVGQVAGGLVGLDKILGSAVEYDKANGTNYAQAGMKGMESHHGH